MKKGLSASGLMSAIGISVSGLVKDWLNNHKIGQASFSIEQEGFVYIINVSGNALFEDFTIEKDLRLVGLKKRLEFRNTTGSTIILSNLITAEIYLRIKKNYNQIHVDCIGKTIKEQNVILFGNGTQTIKVGTIEKGKKYLDGLPVNPTLTQFKDLANQILSGCLEYPSHAKEKYYSKDEYGVGMNNYANALKNKLEP
jgi:hypothetical protein